MAGYQIIRRSEQQFLEESATVNLLGKSVFQGYEIVNIHLPAGKSMILPKSHQKTLNALLLVHQGELLDPEMALSLYAGDCLASDNLDVYARLEATVEADLVFIFSMNGYTPSESGDLALIKRLAQMIESDQAFTKIDFEAFAKLLEFQTEGYFCGAPYDQVYELFSMLVNQMHLSPLKLNPSYIARLCTQWVMASEDLAQGFFEVVVFIKKLYTTVFLPQVDNELIREAVYWTLLDNGEVKTVQYLAKQLFVNRTYLSERFMECAGVSASDYILSVKMHGAMIMLINSKVSLNDVLNKLCYHDLSHFSKNFKKFTGMTPQNFRHKFSFLG